MQEDFDGVIDRHFELNRVSSDTIVLGKQALSSDDQALAGIKPSRTAYIHEDNVVVGKRMRCAARRHSPSPSYTTSSPRMNKRSLKKSSTRITSRGNHDIDGPKDPVKRNDHALPTIHILEDSDDDEEVVFLEVRKPQQTLAKETYGRAIPGSNGPIYNRSKTPMAAPHPPPSSGKSLCQLAEEFLILFTSVEGRYHAIVEYVLRLRYKRSNEEREKLKVRLETILVDGVPASHFGKKLDCKMDVLEAYLDVCTAGFTLIQQDLSGLMNVFEAHAVQAQAIRANEVFTAAVVQNVRDFCRKLKAVNFPIVEDMLEAMLRCLFKNVYALKDFVKVRMGAVELIRREFGEFCAAVA